MLSWHTGRVKRRWLNYPLVNAVGAIESACGAAGSREPSSGSLIIHGLSAAKVGGRDIFGIGTR